MGFVVLIWFLIYMMFRNYDQGLKDSIYRALGLIRDDDIFDVSNNFRMPKRRNSISEINTPDFISEEDTALKKKIKRAESMVKFSMETNPKINKDNLRHWIKWYSMTVMIIHGSKKKVEKLKADRAEKYREELANARRRNLVKDEDASEIDSNTSRQMLGAEDEQNNAKNGQELDNSRQIDQNDERSKFIEEEEVKDEWT